MSEKQRLVNCESSLNIVYSMKPEDIKEKTENLLKEISFKAPLHYEECVEVALLMVDKILGEQPTLVYWNTYDDETPSAVTVWSEVKSELEKLKKSDS